MNKGMIIYTLGKMMVVASILLLLPAAVALFYKDGCVWAFVIPAVLMCLCGVGGMLCRPKNMATYAREGFIIVAAMWIIYSIFGALPFVISGSIPSFTDAFFETVSGFTTTGSSILTNVETLPRSILFWRSLTHWVGGMGVLALAIALLPTERNPNNGKNTDVHILRAETPGPTFGKLVSKLRYNVRILYSIYAVMTVLEIGFLLAGGMPLFDSLVNTFGTAGTGGFAIKNSSIAYYDSAYFDMVISIFMLLFGVNFNIYYFLLIGKVSKVLKSEELHWYLGIVAVSTVTVALNIYQMYGSMARAFRYAFFQVASVITTTGFATANFDLWPTFSKIVLFLLMFVGACASSTGGGLKVSRVIILIKTAVKEVRYMINPREIRTIRCDGVAVEQSVITGVSSYLIIYVLIILVSTLIVSLDRCDFTTTISAVVACLNNIGPGFGEVGAVGNFSHFSALTKYTLSFNMLAGRLELFPLLIMFSPSVWKK